MSLKTRPGSRMYYCQAKRHGKYLRRSTRLTDRTAAQHYHDTVWATYLLLLDAPPCDSRSVDTAIVREVARVRDEVGPGEARRVDIALDHWQRFCAQENIESIDTTTTEHLELYRRRRIQGLHAIGHKTLTLETSYIMRLCRLNHHPLAAPRRLAAKRTFHRAFTPAEVTAFFGACPARLLPLFLCLYATGARLAELQPSKLSHHTPLLLSEVHVDTDIIDLRNAKQRPGQPARSRTVPVAPGLCRLILAAAPVPGQFAFAPTGEPFCHSFDRILRHAGIPKADALGHKLTAHSFRHTRASAILEQTGDVSLAQLALGHSSIQTTQIYVHRQTQAPVVDLAALLGRVQSGGTPTNKPAEGAG